MAEVELAVLTRQCLERRLGSVEILRHELTAWEEERNEQGARVEWRFTLAKARDKLGRLYPSWW